MKPPDDAIETTGATIWMDNGMLIAVSNGLPSTAESIGESFQAFRDLTGGVPAPLLFDGRQWRGGDTEAWARIFSDVKTTLTAFAMLASPGDSAIYGPFFFDRMTIPVRVVTDEAEALEFLKGFLPDQ